MPTFRAFFPLVGLLAVACINLPDIDEARPDVPGGDGGIPMDGGSDGGSQPGTTDGGVDQTAPAVIRTSPPNGATRVALDSTVEVDFSEEMLASTLRVTTSVPGITFTRTSWTPELRRAVFSASAPLEQERQYTLSVEGKDLAGNALLSAYLFTFTTVGPPDTTAPTLVSFLPEPSDGNPRNTSIQFTFSEPMNRLSVEQAFSIIIPQSVAISPAVWNSEGTTVVFSPTNGFPYGSRVDWRLSADAKDLEGNTLSTGATNTFFVIRESTVTLMPESYSTRLVSTTAPAQTTPWAIGDTLTNQPYHGFVTFNLFPLRRDFGSNINITSAQLIWPNSNPSPSTFDSLGRFLVEPLYFETSQSTDNSYLYSRPALGSPVALRHQDLIIQAGNHHIPVTGLLIDAWNERSSRTETAQFRLKFEATTDHDNTPDTFQIDPSGMLLSVTCEYP
jgi:hypothetical protein